MVFILALILGLSLTIGSGYYIWKTGYTGYPGSTVTPLFLLVMGTVYIILTTVPMIMGTFCSILSICAK